VFLAGRNYIILSFTYHLLGLAYYLWPVTFEEYLISKKIDGEAFHKAEPQLFHSWKTEFAEMHANSFSVQKLNLINPIRRKFQLREQVKNEPQVITPPLAAVTITPVKPASPRIVKPVMKPKPKTDENV
jgi:hypothetical protein